MTRNQKRAAWAAGTVAALAGAAVFNENRARAAERATPPVGRLVEVDEVRVHLLDEGAGKGPAVVLLHGNGVLLQDWLASGVFARLVDAGRRVVAVDRPGFGWTARPRGRSWTPAAQGALIGRALGEIGVERPVVVGHSYGTMVALAMALDAPGSVAGLVLLSGYYFPTVRADLPPAVLPAVPGIGDVLVQTVSPLAARLLGPEAIRQSFAPAPVADGVADLPLAMALRPSQLQATAGDASHMISAARAMAPRYAGLNLPVAILAGTGDRIAWPDRHAERLAATVAGATLELLPGQGHMIHYGAPERVTAAVEGVVERVAASSPPTAGYREVA